jgi:C-terminal peptidase prc
MKYIIGLLFLFTISICASDQNASRPLKKPDSYLYQITHVIEEYYVDKNESKVISSKINEKIFNWYTAHCDHNESNGIDELYLKWNAIEQSCPEMNRSAQNKIFNSVLNYYEASVLNMSYFQKDFGSTGLILRKKNDQVIIVGSTENTIPIGTKIIKIDNKLLKDLNLYEVIDYLRGPIGSVVTIISDSNISYSLTRKKFSVQNVIQVSDENHVQTIKINSFDKNVAKETVKIIKELPQENILVLDLRNNGGGLLDSVFDTLCLFVEQSEQELFHTKARDKHDDRTYISKIKTNLYQKPLYIVINNGTGAGALLFAKVLQRQNAIVIGSSTNSISQASVAVPIYEDYVLKFPTAKFYLPDGTVASGTTVTSDIPLDTDSLEDETLYEKIATIIKNR